jgi:hypothetical protein
MSANPDPNSKTDNLANEDCRPAPCSLSEWIASVREKFNLPQTEDQHFKSPHWDGYEACLQDLERFLKANT